MKTQIIKLAVMLTVTIILTFSNILYSQTWFPIGPGINNEFHSIYFTNSNTGYVAGDGIILITTNAGINWMIQNPNTNQALSSIQFIDENTGYVAGGYYPASIIRKTTNGGNNWISQTSVVPSAFWDMFFTNANTGYVGGDWGHLLKTTNGGSLWYLQYTGTNEWLESIYFLNNDTGFIAGANGLILKTSNVGIIWNHQISGTNNYLFSISFANSTTGYCVGGTYSYPYEHIIIKTTNGGNSWFVQKTGTGFWLEYIWLSGVNNAIAAGSNGTILKTNDGGNNWVTQNSGTSNTLREVFFTNANTGYIAGHNGTILKTTNGGLSSLIPLLISPPNWSNGISLTPTLQWSSIMGVINYHVQVSRVSNFAVLTDSATVINNEYTIPSGKLTNTTTYFWRVNASDSTGTGPWSEIWNFSTLVTGIKKVNSNIPGEFNLFQNYPNPFNPKTNIKFDIPKSSNVKIIVYDNLGKEVAKLVDKKLPAGSYEVDWNASSYSSGIYYYRLITEKYVNTKKMLLIK